MLYRLSPVFGTHGTEKVIKEDGTTLVFAVILLDELLILSCFS